MISRSKKEGRNKGRERRRIEGGRVYENKRDDREKMEEWKGRMRKDRRKNRKRDDGGTRFKEERGRK